MSNSWANITKGVPGIGLYEKQKENDLYTRKYGANVHKDFVVSDHLTSVRSLLLIFNSLDKLESSLWQTLLQRNCSLMPLGLLSSYLPTEKGLAQLLALLMRVFLTLKLFPELDLVLEVEITLLPVTSISQPPSICTSSLRDSLMQLQFLLEMLSVKFNTERCSI